MTRHIKIDPEGTNAVLRKFDNLKMGRLTKEQKERSNELEHLLNLKPIFDFYPDFKAYANNEPLRLQALEEYCQNFWLETLRCYIDGSFPASIAMASFTMEASLKYRLINRSPSTSARRDLKALIDYCQRRKIKILPADKGNSINEAARSVLDARDNIVHANFPIYEPAKVIYLEGTEHDRIGTGSIIFIEPFKNLAKETILNTKQVVDYLQNLQLEALI
jgi:hypothetical protein